jgi:hypothetical protein
MVPVRRAVAEGDVAEDLKGEVADLRTDMRTEFATVRGEMREGRCCSERPAADARAAG